MEKKTRRGGPRKFERDQAVEKAMRLFWRQGYEGTSINDLTAAIGIAPPSLYAAFGSKAGLYREALDRYTASSGALDQPAKSSSNLNDAVAAVLHAGVRAITDASRERGCMISSGMIECAPEHSELASDVAQRRLSTRNSIAAQLVRWLDPQAADALAGHLMVVLIGLSVQARDGATADELHGLADEAIAGVRARKLAVSS